MATREQWIQGARPKTFAAAIAPVVLGSGIAMFESGFNPVIAVLALVVSLSLQVGVNYANDYSDGIRGTDEVRVGPIRLVGQGLADAPIVKRAAFISFGVAAVAGLAMTLLSGLWILLPVGLASVVAAWFYTGGKNPYGYAGFGELFVFVFFGLVAVIGTAAAQTGHISWVAVLGGVTCGSLSSAILVTNNLRDIPSDTESGKRTLAVRLGDHRTRELYRLFIVLAYLPPVIMAFSETGPQFAYVGIFSLLIARRPLRIIASGATGRELIPVLELTGQLLLMYSFSFAMAIALSPKIAG